MSAAGGGRVLGRHAATRDGPMVAAIVGRLPEVYARQAVE